MKPFIFALTISIFALGSAFAMPEPEKLYGDRILFDVLRKGSVVGQHETVFERKDGTLIVTSIMNIEIKALFFNVYSFDYRSVEYWRKGQLSELKVDVNDGGEITDIDITHEDATALIKTNGEIIKDDKAFLSTNHWNSDVLDEDRVFNTLTGSFNDVTITHQGKEDVTIGETTILANRYEYRGELTDTWVWYDDKGRWVKLEFIARDGSTITYQCRKCTTAQKEVS